MLMLLLNQMVIGSPPIQFFEDLVELIFVNFAVVKKPSGNGRPSGLEIIDLLDVIFHQ